jgi:tetratricopeptide (TPR) repeat protein
LGEIERAVEDYSKAIELYPDFANAYLNRGRLRYLLRDKNGSRRDQETAERKIAEYKSRVSDSSYSIYSDTTHRFDKLLSFDTNIAGSTFDHISTHGSDNRLALLPLYRFTLAKPDSLSGVTAGHYFSQREQDFRKRIDNSYLTLTARASNVETDTLVMLDKRYAQGLKADSKVWELLFQRGITQTLIKQYTNAVGSFTSAIEQYPANPFLYLNRSTTRAEMIDFISSIDNSYQRITIESDPAKRLQNSQSRTYNYDEAIADLNKAIKLYPDFPYSYYNRANLNALSGNLPEAYNDYTKAIELNPSFAEAYYNRGLVQIFMKDTRKGCLDMSKAGELGIQGAYEILKQYTAY